MKKFAGIVLVLALLYGVRTYINASTVNANKIVKESILKDRSFEANVVEITSAKGIKAYLLEDKTNPIISVNFLFKNVGTAYDPQGKKGLANMVSGLLVRGAGNLKAESLKEELELKAIGISFDADKDDVTGSLITTKENEQRAFELLNMILTKPRFDEKEIKFIKDRLLFALNTQFEKPNGELNIRANEIIFAEHPYSNNPYGEAKDIKNIVKGDLDGFVADALTLDRLIVGISGDITPEETKLFLDNVFGGLKEKSNIQEISAFDETSIENKEVKIERDSAQRITTFAMPGVSRNDADFYPLYVVNYILGGSGLSSRLSLRARENESLTYGIYTFLSLNEKANLIRGGFSSTPENSDKVVDILNEEIKKVGEKGIMEKELNAAKRYLVSSYNLRFADIDSISSQLTYMQRYNLGIDFLQKRNEYIDNITIEDANRAAKKFFGNDSMILITIGSFNLNEGKGK